METRLLFGDDANERVAQLERKSLFIIIIVPAALMRKAPKLRPAAARSSRFRGLIDEHGLRGLENESELRIFLFDLGGMG